MQYLVDYHVHTNHSFDSRVNMADYCQRAVALGLKEIVFTEHFDLNPHDLGLGYFNYGDFSREVEACREKFAGKLSIKKGLELGEPHLYREEHEKFIQSKDFDFLLGSVHYVDSLVLHREYGEESEKEVYIRYFTEVLKTAQDGFCHVLGHLDVLKRYVPANFAKFKASDYEEIIKEILKKAILNGKGIEVNTSGFRQGLNEPLPSLEIVKWYKELGGEIITLGSDAHRIDELGKDISKGSRLIKELGFKGIWTFTNGQPQLIDF